MHAEVAIRHADRAGVVPLRRALVPHGRGLRGRAEVAMRHVYRSVTGFEASAPRGRFVLLGRLISRRGRLHALAELALRAARRPAFLPGAVSLGGLRLGAGLLAYAFDRGFVEGHDAAPGVNRFSNPRLLRRERAMMGGGGRSRSARPPRASSRQSGQTWKRPRRSAEAFMVELSGVEPLTS